MATKRPTVSQQLKAALLASGETRYAVSKATGISQSSLSRFASRGTGLSQEAIDVLADYLDLELAPRGKKRKGAGGE
jgi:transcriptional regulator with XRE-family HTH domain